MKRFSVRDVAFYRQYDSGLGSCQLCVLIVFLTRFKHFYLLSVMHHLQVLRHTGASLQLEVDCQGTLVSFQSFYLKLDSLTCLFFPLSSDLDVQWGEKKTLKGIIGIIWSLLQVFKMVLCLVAQLCLALHDPMDCSPPDSSVHGILQTRILEWVAISSSRGSSQPRDQTQVSHIAGGLFTI